MIFRNRALVIYSRSEFQLDRDFERATKLARVLDLPSTKNLQVEQLCNIAIERGKTILEKVKLYEIQIRIILAKNQILLAIETGLKVIKMLGVSLYKSPPQELNIENLAKLPRMSDPYKIAAIEILMLVHPAACFAESPLALPILYTKIEISRKYGNSPCSVYAYAVYGNIIAWLIPDIDFAYQLGQLAWLLLERLNAREFASKLIVAISINITHWKKHTRETIEPLIRAIKSALEVGDIEFACYAAHYYCLHLFFNGNNLDRVRDEQKKYLDLIRKNKQEHQLILSRIFSELVLVLLDSSLQINILKSNFISKLENLANLQAKNLLAMFSIYFAKCFIFYLFKDYAKSLEASQIGAKYSGFVRGEIIFTRHIFYYSLAILVRYKYNRFENDLDDRNEREQFLIQVQENQQKINYWARYCPINYQHKYDLVAAEKARVLGENWQASELYERAIQGAKKSESIQEEAIAYERAAEFYFALGREEIGQLYLKNARDCYTKWGAKAKVIALENEYPKILKQTIKNKKIAGTRGNFDTDGELLDLKTVIEASRTLTSEIVLKKLLAKLMKTLITNAGAEKGFLILKKGKKWTIEAESKINSEQVKILRSIAIEALDPEKKTPILPNKIINYVIRTRENIVLDNAINNERYNSDLYIINHRSKSILCTPLLDRGQLRGILYLENNLTTGAFTSERVELLKILSAQAAISIQNAKLYEERLKAELALRQSQQQLAQFLDALPVGIFIADREGKPYYLNQIAKQLTGKEVIDSLPVEQIPETYNTYLAGSDRLYPPEKSPIYQALQGETTYIPDMEIRSPDPHKAIIPLDVWTTPICNKVGKVEYVISAFQDISDRKRLEEENLLLQQVGEDISYSYQIGGGLAANAASYVVRAADRQLYQEILQAKFCYVFNARQMGKSSLRNKIIGQLRSKGYYCGAIDLTEIGSSDLNAEQWYASLIFNLAKSIKVDRFNNRNNFSQWWKSLDPISPISKFKEFICEIILKNIDTKIVIFIDEIDSIKRLSFDTNDFLALIRFLYDDRPQNKYLNRLTFVLLGATNPSTLISDPHSTPFNIGSSIGLEGFKINEIQPLARGLSELCDNSTLVLQEILNWTGGQPFLTQKICYLIKQSQQNIATGTEAKEIEKLVRKRIITNWKTQDNPAHFQVIEQNILKSTNKFNLLKIYRQILEKESIPSDDSDEQMDLIVSGLVRSSSGLLKVFNHIYATIFNLDWLEANLN